MHERAGRPGGETRHAGGALRKSMKMLGALLITLSAISPASSFFIIAPGVVATAGSGAFLSMVAAAAICLCLALVYAELASAYPLTGGEYAIVEKVLGRLPGFVVMVVMVLTSVLIPSVMALGLSGYLDALHPGLPPRAVAIAAIVITTVIATLNVRANAALTGLFLLVEMLALAAFISLGFDHATRPLSELLHHPVLPGATGLARAPGTAIVMATSVAIFAYNGYGSAVYFGEETHDAHRHVARAILWALVIGVATELTALTAFLLGAPDFARILASPSMMGDFTVALAGPTAARVLGLAIALAIFNALIAMLLLPARMIYSTGRDGIWPAPVSRAMTRVHTRFHSPWVATVTSGALAVGGCLVKPDILFVITGTGLIVVAGFLCVAAIAGRRNGTTAHAAYRMPLFPAAPALALLALGLVTYANWLDPAVGRPSLLTTLALCGAAAAYHLAFYRRPRASSR